MRKTELKFDLKNGADAKRVSAGITHGSLCSGGIDGMAEGARRVGIDTIWNCEINKFARKLLKQEYPNAKQYKDVENDTPEERPRYEAEQVGHKQMMIRSTTVDLQRRFSFNPFVICCRFHKSQYEAQKK